MVVVIVLVMGSRHGNSAKTQKWNPGFTAENYFRDNQTGSDRSFQEESIAFAPYVFFNDFSALRTELEQSGEIPEPDHTDYPDFYGFVGYNEDTSIYCVEMEWRNNEDFHFFEANCGSGKD